MAWGGSFYILALTLTGTVKPLPGGRSLARQLLRPIGLTQLIFAGYTALTSIFYFLDLQGYFYLSHNPMSAVSSREIALAAEAQRYYVLGHAAFATGVLLAMDYRRSGEWTLQTRLDWPWFLLWCAGGLFVATQALSVVPGLARATPRAVPMAMEWSPPSTSGNRPLSRAAATLSASRVQTVSTSLMYFADGSPLSGSCRSGRGTVRSPSSVQS